MKRIQSTLTSIEDHGKLNMNRKKTLNEMKKKSAQ